MHASRSVVLLSLLAAVLTACGGAAAPGSSPTPSAPASSGGAVTGGAVIAEGRVVPVHYAQLSVGGAGGVVSELLAQPGQAVKAGDVLLRVQGTEFEAALAQAQAGLAAAEARLGQAQLPARPEQIAVAEAQVRAAQAQAAQAAAQRDEVLAAAHPDDVIVAQQAVAQAEAQLRYAEAVHDASVGRGGPAEWLARQQRDEAAAAVISARAQLDRLQKGATEPARRAAAQAALTADEQVSVAQANLALLRVSPRPEDLAPLRAVVDQARAAVAQAQAAVDALTLRAPFAGTVADVVPKVGERVNPGDAAVVLADYSSWVVETKDLTELSVVNVKDGGSVTITLAALPGVTLSGTVVSIARVYVERQGDVTYLVRVALAEAPPELRWGMTAAATFEQ